jgi:hypothetical protein
MAKMTSAYANKVLKKLNDDKDFYLNKEQEGQIYVAALDEEPVIPDYDYAEVSAKIAEIDEKIINMFTENNMPYMTIAGTEKGYDDLVEIIKNYLKMKGEK